MPHRAFIGIGTNLGDRAGNYRDSIARITALPETRIVRQSSVYESEPVDADGPSFFNGAIEVETEFAAEPLMSKLLTIERVMGRKRVRGKKPRRRGKYPARIIDLDLLFFDKETVNKHTLQVPHPRLHERRFVLVPMSELAPALIHPKLNESISELLAKLKAPQRITLIRADQMRPAPSRREVMRT